MRIRFRATLPLLLFALLSAPALVGAQVTGLVPSDAIELSTQTPDRNSASKIKIVRMGNGTLVVVYADGGSDELVYDTKGDSERVAHDMFVTTCNPNMVDCSDAASWSPRVNISNTASQSSISSAWRGPDAGELPYYGDSGKPQVFNNGPALVVTWKDAYCPGGDQRTVTYLERDERVIPFRCIWAARSLNNGATWSAPEQLSSGLRDAAQVVSRGSAGAWVVTWQEDPQGLQLGEGDGPGEGASGAHVSHGTDIWYSALSRAAFDAGDAFPVGIRLTNNFTQVSSVGMDPTEYERGQQGASRANLALVGPTVIVAYEETRGAESIIDGKNIRYHVFPFNSPPTSCEMEGESCRLSPWGDPFPSQTDPARAGCILSNPGENARRVRFVFNATPPASETRLLIFWRQGRPTGGGPADIVGRTATGFEIGDFRQALALPSGEGTMDGCFAIGDEDEGTGAYANAAPINFSAESPTGGDLEAETFANNLEDARAHRAIIKGDFVMLGYTYTSDGVVANATDLDHHNFYVRRSLDGGETWDAPVDLTTPIVRQLALDNGLRETGVNVREPRLVKTPGNGPGCPSGDPDDESTTRPSDCGAGGTVIVAFGTQTNVYEHIGGAVDLDIFITRTTDRGASFEPMQVLAADPLPELESQIRPTPDGNTVFAVWNRENEPSGSDGLFAVAVEGEVEEPMDMDAGVPDMDAGTPSEDAGTPGTDAGSSGADAGELPPCECDDGCGCVAAGAGQGSPLAPLAGAGLLGLVCLRRRRR